MSITKANPANPYGDGKTPQDNHGDMGEYRPTVVFSVSKVYTTANVPAAASGNLSIIIWVTDAPAGDQLQFSDGTAWQPIRY